MRQINGTMTAIALPRPRNTLLDRLRTIQFGIGARGAVGVGLATQRGGAAIATSGLLDTFTDADNTLLTDHVPDAAPIGAAWGTTIAVYGSPGPLKVIDNTARQTALSGKSIGASIIETGLSDGVLTANLRTSNQSGVDGQGVWFRCVDANNTWYVDITPGYYVILGYAVGGVGSNVVIHNCNLLGDTDYQIVVTLKGNDITVTVGGESIQYTSSIHATATKIAISSTFGNTSATQFYDIEMAAL